MYFLPQLILPERRLVRSRLGWRAASVVWGRAWAAWLASPPASTTLWLPRRKTIIPMVCMVWYAFHTSNMVCIPRVHSCISLLPLSYTCITVLTFDCISAHLRSCQPTLTPLALQSHRRLEHIYFDFKKHLLGLSKWRPEQLNLFSSFYQINCRQGSPCSCQLSCGSIDSWKGQQ